MHCHYCKAALYTMSWDRKTMMATKTPHSDIQTNSDGQYICSICSDRIVRSGAQIACATCDKPIYRVKRDFFQDRQLEYSNLEGIAPQHDPIEGVTNRCAHCRQKIEWEGGKT